jgi:hypothetical protein
MKAVRVHDRRLEALLGYALVGPNVITSRTLNFWSRRLFGMEILNRVETCLNDVQVPIALIELWRSPKNYLMHSNCLQYDHFFAQLIAISRL